MTALPNEQSCDALLNNKQSASSDTISATDCNPKHKIMSLTNASPEQAARAAKTSSRTLATLSAASRNLALDAIHDALSKARDEILAANAVDLEKAKQSTANGELNPSIYKRLDLSRKGKFDDMLQGIRDVRELPDPGR